MDGLLQLLSHVSSNEEYAFLRQSGNPCPTSGNMARQMVAVAREKARFQEGLLTHN